MSKSVLARAVLVAVLVGGWFLLRAVNPGAAASARDWTQVASERTAGWVGILGEISLALMVGGLIFVAYYPFKGQSGYDRQWGIALCLSVAGVLVVIAGVMALGMVYQWRWLVLALGVPAIGIALMMVGGLVAEGVKGMKKGK